MDMIRFNIQEKQCKEEQGQNELLPNLSDLMNNKTEKTDDYPRKAPMIMSTSRQTHEWLIEARKMVSSSPARTTDSPSRLVPASPRFVVAAQPYKDNSSALNDHQYRDPLSRSARRHRSSESISGEILSRSARYHGESPDDRYRRFDNSTPDPEDYLTTSLPPRHPSRRKSRFTDDSQPPVPPRRTFRNSSPGPGPAAVEPDSRNNLVLSPPRNLVETAHRRSISSSTCSLEKLSILESQNGLDSSNLRGRRSISVNSVPGFRNLDMVVDEDVTLINSFLVRQRALAARIVSRRMTAKAKIVLSDSSAASITSSMVATICYAFLLENDEKREGNGEVVVPMMNIKRGRMHRQKQAAWLFHYLGIDGSALLFSDDIDLEDLMKARQATILVTGKDVLNTNSEVGSQCTVLTDHYCEGAFDLLKTPSLKKLLLAGIMLDTYNLDKFAKFHTHRDAEAVQLLLVGSVPSFRYELFEQLMQDPRDRLFLESLRHNYGNPSTEYNDENGAPQEHNVTVRKSMSASLQEVKQKQTQVLAPVPAPSPVPSTPETTLRRKNKLSLGKWFGFSSKS
ncbi:hypothetical protein J5N97_020438 [Dioscorea zingiberensis]|uniref:Uncharacterized protein n=1 Tax=Dioscorea zingiberensis TaxID=325984 RepID=A0A9D5CGM7_9LILI|nr:hypothetical protein J5N97_020438 [Dioscorea zingiberensis]